jgi:hypothetical protein
MEASKLTNGNRDEVLAKGSVPARKSVNARAAVRSEAKKVESKSTGKKAKAERHQVKAIKKSKSEKLVCRIAEATTWPPASSSGAIADAASASVSATDRLLARRRPTVGRNKFSIRLDHQGGSATDTALPFLVSSSADLPTSIAPDIISSTKVACLSIRIGA